MTGFPILDLVVGIIFIYFLLSIISSSAVEIMLTMLKVRSKVLQEWMVTIFDKPYKSSDTSNETTLGQAILDHCSVTALSGQGNAPSYIDAKNFASALLEKITYDPSNPDSIAGDLDAYIAAIQKTDMLSHEFKRVILVYANEAKETYKAVSEKTQSEIDLFRTKIETWFDSSMDRVAGKLKGRYSRVYTFWIAVVTTVLLNADSISITKYLYNNPEARAKVVADAYATASDTTISKKIRQVNADLQKTADSITLKEVEDAISQKTAAIKEANASLNNSIPLGWSGWQKENWDTVAGWKGHASLIFLKIVGLTATILAICMGAPFWFDTLNKIANLRGSGAKPSTTEEKVGK